MNDGGPAFPAYKMHGLREFVPTPGMSLRDWFAGMALQGIIASGPHDCTMRELSIESYGYADAMIAARDDV